MINGTEKENQWEKRKETKRDDCNSKRMKGTTQKWLWCGHETRQEPSCTKIISKNKKKNLQKQKECIFLKISKNKNNAFLKKNLQKKECIKKNIYPIEIKNKKWQAAKNKHHSGQWNEKISTKDVFKNDFASNYAIHKRVKIGWK